MPALPRWIRRHLLAVAAAPLMLPVLAFAFYLGGQELGYALLGGPDGRPAPALEDQRFPPGSPAYLVQRHDCWNATQGQPADVEAAGHVVVTVAGRTRYAGARLTGLALEQELFGIDHGLLVHGFCR